jgi:hypothetical protein
MFFFYFQATCQRVLRRQFDREYFRSIVKAHRLEFLALRNSLEEVGASFDFARLRVMLKCDFLALTYLLEHAAGAKQHRSNGERLLTLYFHWQLLSLAVRCLLRVGEKRAVLRLTSVLQYFANVVGQRVGTTSFGNSMATDYFFLNS